MKPLRLVAAAAAMAIAGASLAAGDEAKPVDQRVHDITAPELRKRLRAEWKDDRPIAIDLRAPEEYRGGHLIGARRIGYPADDFEERIAKLDRGLRYIVYCADGIESAKAVALFRKLEFKEVYYLRGGWKAHLKLIGGKAK